MMLALESSTNGILDRSLAKLEQRPTAATTSNKWSMRRWSLHGSDMKSPVINTSAGKSIKSPPPPPPPAQQAKHTPQDKKKKRSRSVDLSPLHSNLKKAPAGLTAKLSQCVEALGLKDALHRYHHNSDNTDSSKDHEMDAVRSPNSKGHRVHFPTTMEALCQSCERPETTEEEKQLYHYTRHELMDMVLDAKESLARETHFCSQPEATIFEQGYLTFPNETHFFHHKRHYCLLKPRGELVCYSSPAHAAKNVHVRCRMSIIKVQECSTMSMQAKIAAFGAHLPSTLSLLFFVTKADGERVLLAAESRSSKKSWVHTLTRVTQVHESLPRCVLRQSSTASTCTSEDDGERSELNAQDLAVLDGETPECAEASKDYCKVASPCGVALEESNNNCNDR